MDDMIGMELASAFIEAYNKTIGDEIREQIAERRSATMKVSCKGFTGELEKLEKKIMPVHGVHYDISVYDEEKDVTYVFEDVRLEDVKFLGGAVSFGG